MAIHKDKNSMLKESLIEMIDIADYCLKTRKENGGYYGFPASIILLSLIDSIGAHYGYGKSKRFHVLNNKELFGLNLREKSIDVLYHEYRNQLFHENLIKPGAILRMGKETDVPFEISTNRRISVLNLLSLLKFSKKAVSKLLSKLK